MKWVQIEGNWKQIKGNLREILGKLLDNPSMVMAGKREQLAGRILADYNIMICRVESQYFDSRRPRC